MQIPVHAETSTAAMARAIAAVLAVALAAVMSLGAQQAERAWADDSQEVLAPKELAQEEEVPYTQEEQDEISLDALNILRNGNPDYVNLDNVKVDAFLAPVTVARGIATYNISEQDSFEMDMGNYLSTAAYEIPVYDVDPDGGYYVAFPNINLHSEEFGMYGFSLTYDNNKGEAIDGWHYENDIAYIPKEAVDDPKNESELIGGVIAMQTNYFYRNGLKADEDGNADFSKNVLVEVLDPAVGTEPMASSVRVANMNDTYVAIEGMPDVSKDELIVMVNGMMLPIAEDAYTLDEYGVLTIISPASIINSVLVIIDRPEDGLIAGMASGMAKGLMGAAGAIGSAMGTGKAYAEGEEDFDPEEFDPGDWDYPGVTPAEMEYFRDSKGRPVEINVNVDDVFVGWRGYYSDGNFQRSVDLKRFKGAPNSAKYMYGGYVKGNKAEYTHEPDAKWAIASYALGSLSETVYSSPNVTFTKDTQVTHTNVEGARETHTIYEWMLIYRNSLKRNNGVYYGDGTGRINGLGGYTNFAARFPSKVTGFETNLVSTGDNVGRENVDLEFEFNDEIENSYFVMSCSHIDRSDVPNVDDEVPDPRETVFVTCIDLTEEYIVLAFAIPQSGNSGGDSQSAFGIYKFKLGAINIAIDKSSANPSITDNNACYSLQGAKYGVFSTEAAARTRKAADAVAVLTTDANGHAETGKTVKPGTYFISEIAPSKGYALDEAIYTVSGNAGAEVRQAVKERPYNDPTDIWLGKVDLETTQNMPQGAASLEGAEFTVNYYDGQYELGNLPASPTRSWVVATDADGYARLSNTYKVSGDEFYLHADGNTTLPLGTVTVQETRPPEGYLLGDAKVYIQHITQTGATGDIVDVYNEQEKESEQVIRGGLSVPKVDRELDENLPLGSATLAGAEVEIRTLNDGDVLVDGNRFKKGEVVKTIVTGEDGVASTASDTLPYGDYEVREVKAPTGYLLNSEWSAIVQVREEGAIVTSATVDDQVKRGDLKFVKVGEDSMHRLANVAFRLTSKTTGESHVLVTDENGQASTANSWNPHAEKTNANDGADNKDGTADQSKLDNLAGVWFNGRTDRTTSPNGELGALPYDTYELQELAGETNSGFRMIEVPSIVVSRHDVEIELGTLDDKKVNIATTLTDGSGSHYVGSTQTISLIDNVSYEGLEAGKPYTMQGRLIDKESGEPVTLDGFEVTASQDFVPSMSSGTLEMAFEVDMAAVAGKDLVAFERLVEADGRVVGSHEDPDDPAQTVHVPEIGTSLTGPDGSKSVVEDRQVTVSDRLDYKNLEPGVEHVAKGTLHQKGADGSDLGPVTGEDGSPVSAEARFTPESASGSVTLEFTFDATSVASTEIVAFEEVYRDEALYAVHADIGDPAQTVSVTPPPSIEKYIDRDVHQRISGWDQAFTYDIMAFVTSDAVSTTITDELVSNIEFAGGPDAVKVSDMGTENNHATAGEFSSSKASGEPMRYGRLVREPAEGEEGPGQAEDGQRWHTVAEIEQAMAADPTLSFAEADAPEDAPMPAPSPDATVAAEGADITDKAQVSIDGKLLSVRIDGLEELGLRGHWVRVTFDAKLAEDAEWALIEDNGTVLTDQPHAGNPNSARYTIDVKDNPGKYDVPSNTVTVVPPAPPAIEKYINKDVHEDLESLSETFTYDVLAYITSDAVSTVIYDELVGEISFVSGPADVKVDDMGKAGLDEVVDGTRVDKVNNHHVNGSFSEGQAYEDATVTAEGASIADKAEVAIEGRKLTVRIDDLEAKGLRDHWVRVTFQAKADAVGELASIGDNAPVLSSKPHTGIPNQAGYTIDTAEMPGKYDIPSNIVTVIPPTAPAIEKYINKDVHEDLEAIGEAFAYDIIAYVTPDADGINIYDDLVGNLRFACAAEDVKVADMGVDDNHFVNGTYSAGQASADATVTAEGADISAMAEIAMDGQSLAVRIADAKPLRGHWVRVTFDARVESDGGYRAIDDNSPLVSDYAHEGIPNTARYEVVVAGQPGEPIPSNTVTVTPPVEPAIEKYVNKDVHQDLEALSDVFAYDIMAYITRDAVSTTITDELVGNLEFAGGADSVKVAALPGNNHKVSGAYSVRDRSDDATVASAGEDITAKCAVSIDGRKLSVRIDGLEKAGLRGYWIRVTFDAKATSAEGFAGIAENAPVLSGEPHEGIPNTASYTIDTADRPSAYNLPSNTVTVRPPVVELRTIAKDKKDGDKVVSAGDAVIVDTVAYKGLVPGREYRLVGTLADKGENKLLEVSGENIRAEMAFTPQSESGEVEMEFPAVNFEKLAGRHIVVFEELYIMPASASAEPGKAAEGKLVAEHKDLGDADQTVSVANGKETRSTSGSSSTKTTTPAKAGSTTASTSYDKAGNLLAQFWWVAAALLLAAAAAGAYAISRRRGATRSPSANRR